MPRRDAFGKQPSGQQNRKRRRAKKAEDAKLREADTGDRAALLAELGEPPLDDPSTAMEWYRRAQLILLRELMKDPAIAIKELFGAVKQMSEAAGKTRDAAAIESRLLTIEQEIDGARARTSAVEMSGTDGVPIPPTARGGSRARRPRPLEIDPPRSDGT